MRWPASNPGNAVVTFEDVANEWKPVSFGGPWAFFRLIDAGRPQRESDRRLVLDFKTVGHGGRVVVEPESIRNPLTNRAWQRAGCGR